MNRGDNMYPEYSHGKWNTFLNINQPLPISIITQAAVNNAKSNQCCQFEIFELEICQYNKGVNFFE